MKKCNRCERDETTTTFYAWLDIKCIPCRKEWRKEYETPERLALAYAKAVTKNRMEVYGVSQEQYAFMAKEQGGKCLNCGSANGKRSLSVDHNHDTGQIRGLLCHKCNRGIGIFHENPELLRTTAMYIEKQVHKTTSLFE